MKPKMTPGIEEIKNKAIPVLKRYGVVHAGIFGSFARGELEEGSDIDILVEFKGRKGLLDLVRAERGLSETLGIKVELLTEGAISPYLRDRIKEELKVIYDEKG